MIGIVLASIALLVVIELIALGWLASTVKTYKSYWINKANEPGQVTYLALGDSAAQGIGATSPSRGYVGVVASRVEERTNKTVRIINLSKTGAKMSDYLKEQAPKVKNTKANLVTIEIGANDILKFQPDKFRSEFREVLATLPDGAYVSNMPLFNSRPASTDKAKQASLIIGEEIKSYPRLHFVDLQAQTTEHQSIFGFAPDLFHPNNLSYKVWADAFWEQIEKTTISN